MVRPTPAKAKGSGPKARIEEEEVSEASERGTDHDAESEAESEAEPVTPAPTTSKKPKRTPIVVVDKGKSKDDRRSSFFVTYPELPGVDQGDEDGHREFFDPEELQTFLQEDPTRYKQLFDDQNAATSRLNKTLQEREIERRSQETQQETLIKIRSEVSRYLTQLKVTEQERDELRHELDNLKMSMEQESEPPASRQRPRQRSRSRSRSRSQYRHSRPYRRSRTRSRTRESKPAKTYKFADPPVFSDGTGTDMKFRSWRTAMESKLKANADHFSTPDLRKTYVASRLTGAAYDQIVPGLNDDNDDTSFDDGDDILDYLEAIYGDPVRQERAEHDFEVLRMKDTDKFAIFLAEFTRLANDAQIPHNKRVKLLHRKLIPKLQHKLVGKASKTDVTINEYIEKAHRYGSCEYEASDREPSRAKPKASGCARYFYLRPRLDVAEMAKRKSEGRCFECNEQGHMGKDCPKRALRLAAETKAKVAVVDLKDMEAPAPLAKNHSEQEKA
ncbi:hypothetical protein N7509_000436 [Penicillium cosmopolitanum]|uniref:CCHC-type domain-containing protein n=1 Tax=Penicillium cosmopolitanum TaxID=1131564 RepID=A0A9X0BE74_9EURO|nr:uncharacterized protein N7509_000436 [Penicillium cosmopolitanum]KAJ5413809.1 hypothetical protein N7509_000436 [Penicillium cosmopolitanum]